MSTEQFYGYCFPVAGEWHTPSVTLRSPEEVYRYTQLHGKSGMFQEVRVTDESDHVVVQMVDGNYTWPEEWKQLNKEVKTSGETNTAKSANASAERRNEGMEACS